MSRFITCEPRGVSHGVERFPDQEEAPCMKEWRCELTALSQRLNYYFVACNDAIHVHQPSFPEQTVTGSPSIILNPPCTQATSLFYQHPGIDEYDPHSINRILVDYLGNDEILLVACDDGDVIVYRIEEIQVAIEARLETSEAEPTKDVRIFLHRNLGSTTWGIAVHREARMIAFSANTHKITIIAFALSDQSQGANKSSDATPDFSDEESEADFPLRRRRDHTFQVQARSNIPAVSFDNTGKDPRGRWLSSSSIDGRTIMFDLHVKKVAAILSMGWCMSTQNANKSPLTQDVSCQCIDSRNYPHATWGAIFLDTSSAHTLESPDELETEMQDKAPFFEDASMQKNRFTVQGTRRIQAAQMPPLPVGETSMAANTDDEDEVSEDSQDSLMGEPGYMPTTGQFSIIINNSLHSGLMSDFMSPKLFRDVKPYFEVVNKTNNRVYHFPSLIITKGDIFLLQRSSPGADEPYRTTTIRQPLHPGQYREILSSSDRHCFFKQVPELGIFIVASPVGRAAIFGLTRYREPNQTSDTYGMKLEYVLPFVKGKEEDIRSLFDQHNKLVGIAVSPVQGMLDRLEDDGAYDARACGEGMWRLMMYYTDHSVLSYEISRKKRDGEMGLGDIVV